MLRESLVSSFVDFQVLIYLSVFDFHLSLFVLMEPFKKQLDEGTFSH